MIRNLIGYLSAHVCSALIASGYVASTLTVTGATNAAPIEITTSTPHLLSRQSVVVIAGVTGNLGANGSWFATPTSSTTFTIADLNGPAAGTGAYVSGGTVQTALVLGKILLGRQWVMQNQARPRIVAIPVEAPIVPRDQYAIEANELGSGTLEPNQLAALLAPAVAVTHNIFEIQCWGGQPSPDPDYDFDYTEALRDQVIRSADALFRGNYTVAGGKWIDQQEKGVTTDLKLGHLMTFFLSIDAPVAETPNVFAGPSASGFVIDVYGLNQGPSGELAAEITR